MVRHLAIGQQQVSAVSKQPARVYGICTSTEHPTDSCPTLQETDANISGIYTNQQQQYRSPNQQYQNYNPYSHTYNPGWREHPNLKWGGNNSSSNNKPPFRQQPPPPPPPAQRSEPSFQEMMQQMATNNLQFQQNMQATVQDLKIQGNVSAITLRSGKVLPAVVATTPDSKNNSDAATEKHVPLPFPNRPVAARKKPKSDNELLDMFSRIEVNIPLLDAIRQVPKYAKFLKELCTNKRKLKGNERVSIGRNGSALLQNKNVSAIIPQDLLLKLPQKCKDPGIFTILCTIGEEVFTNGMLDLGASINVMPASVFRSL
ncbi:uncharacterized protein LOC113859494 [Abrus precatorius]|uniref:Uncharacterized protein LOC113859494 n=1 Tax=Abrus precatorius TaxID=3816 RepID=A0A8B8L094_ABRPR|nr:uncharacterized protein LOC113859494 [Abrus precatorius]